MPEPPVAAPDHEARVKLLRTAIEGYLGADRTSSELEGLIFDALERAHARSTLKLGDADLGVYQEEVVAALRPRASLVANVIFDEPDARVLEYIAFAHVHGGRDGDHVWFDAPGMAMFDGLDPDDAPLWLTGATADGAAITVYATSCGDVGELERRLTRAFGDAGWTVDDHGEGVPVGREP